MIHNSFSVAAATDQLFFSEAYHAISENELVAALRG
jgi:hypothetical protein